MDQPSISSCLRPGSELDSSGRTNDRRAAVAQMMAENREGSGMKVIAVMVQRYAVLPKDLWDLNSISDMGAGRGVTYGGALSKAMFESILENNRYTIINLTIGENVSHEVEFPSTLRSLTLLSRAYPYRLDPLPENLEQLTIAPSFRCNYPLVLPANLKKLNLDNRFYVLPLQLPQGLVELEFASYSQFNLPLALPASLRSIQFGEAYNQPTALPAGLEKIKMGSAFRQDLLLPNTLRKIDWCCNHPIQIPEGIPEIYFGAEFNQPVLFAASLKRATFRGKTYSHPLSLPTGLEDLFWINRTYEGLSLPAGLRRLTWWSDRSVTLPSSLKELRVDGSASLILPSGLLKLSVDFWSQRHYDLPESVQELSIPASATCTHPTILHHLILTFGDEIDLSRNRIYKLTVAHPNIRIKNWPQGLEELEFTVDEMNYVIRVPAGCRIVGVKRPTNVILE